MFAIPKRSVLLFLVAALLLVGLCSCMQAEPTQPPVFRDLLWAVSAPLPKAEDFAVSLAPGATLRYAEEYTFLYLGEYELELILSLPNGRESTHKVKLTLCTDTVPPTIEGLRDLSATLGGSVAYLSGVTVKDNCDGALTLTVDHSAVDLTQAGIYPVVYTATDHAGNRTVLTVSLTVYEQEITDEMLYTLLDAELARIISDSMTTVQKLQAVYDFVYDSIRYASASDKSTLIRAAYAGLTQKEGDCYTYFALAKVCFERLGIENIDLQRRQETVAKVGERHFWSLVNVGTEESPRWYHFDATHLTDREKPWGFLMTDAQLAAYSAERLSASGVADYFYDYDTLSVPKSATEVITPIS